MTPDVDLRGARALVTGGAGFVGSHIVDHLLGAGAESVIVLDDFSRGRIENLRAAESNPALVVVAGDIRDAALVNQLSDGVDHVFHQAALRITHCAEDPVRAMQVMVTGTQNVLEAAVRNRVTKVVLASSASVYGEPDLLPIAETAPFNNRTIYGAAKIANEQTARAYTEMYGLRYLALRPFNIYGPRMDAFGVYTEVMIRWLEKLGRGDRPVVFGDGKQTMDFVFVTDVARANLLAAASDTADDFINVGTGSETSLKELCSLLCEAAGHPDLEPIFAEARKVNGVTRRMAAIDRARDSIGFEARVGLREGLRELVAWYPTAIPTLPTAVR